MHPDTEIRFINAIIGYGVVAKRFIPQGTIIWVQDELDRVFTQKDILEISPLMQHYIEKYSFTNNIGEKVLCWDHAKYMNHSFKSNCMSTAYDFEIAVRNIHPGEQLTDDYGYLNVSVPFTPQEENTQRTVVYPDDILRYFKIWDDMVIQNLSNIKSVHQPLMKFVNNRHLNDFGKVCAGEEQLRSIRSCYFEAGITHFGH